MRVNFGRLVKLPREIPIFKVVAFGGVVLALVLTRNLFIPPSHPQVIQTSPVSLDQRYWIQRITTVGAETAYQEFKKRISSESLGIQHGLAHTIGEAIYQSKGLPGFSVCDTDFNYGCYHGFMASALASQGLSALPELNQSCLDKYHERPSPCQHGLGHGLLAYLGRAKLNVALEYCKLTHQTDPLNGCTAGVFMENNISSHFSTKVGENSVRPLDPANPASPCNNAVPEEFRPSCYYEIGLWWREVYQRDFDKIGQLCQNISSNTERFACFKGLGVVIAPTTEYAPELAVKLCQKMSTREGEIICRSGVYGVMSGLKEAKDRAPAVCRDLKDQEFQACTQS